MINNIPYEKIIEMTNILNKSKEAIESLATNNNCQELDDFVSSIDVYSKYLANIVELNKVADEELEDLLV